jgi:hypothetical protein
MKLINKILIAGAAVSMAACTDSYIDINSNPYQPGDLTADDYALGSAMNNIAGTVISADVNTAQFTECLLGGPLGGYFADANSSWRMTIANYSPKDDWSRVFLKSDKIISTLYSNYTMVESFCETTDNPVPLAIASIIKVAAMHRVADTYGPIPYTQIGADGNLATPYDNEETVYKAFINELDEAIATLNANAGSALNPSSDFVYSGDVHKWIKFANSLKLRLAMRIVYAAPDYSRTVAEAAVDPANGGVIETNDDNAKWDYFQATTNPLYTAVHYNEGSSLTGGDTHAAADIICYMNGYKDPRRAMYFSASQWTGIDYAGLRRGLDGGTFSSSWGFNFSGVNVQPSDPLVWMNAAEVSFLRAEATAVFGFSMGGSAEEFYNNGIRLSFEQWGVSGAEEYLADATSMPATYEDPSGNNPYSGSLSTITIKWDESASVEKKQERIITQKWIANWLIGNESWADLRRTGYPVLMPVVYNGSSSIIANDQTPGRMPYPQEEYTNNASNVQFAVQHYLNGPDNIATKLWWACKK